MGARRTKYRIGDVVALPLGDGTYGYGRIYKDLGLGILRTITNGMARFSDISHCEITKVVSCEDTKIVSGEWPIIGNLPFANEDEAWGPPRYARPDVNSIRYLIHDRGEIIPGSAADIQGLEPWSGILPPEDVVELILAELTGKRRQRSSRLEETEPGGAPRRNISEEGIFDNETAPRVRSYFEDLLETGMTPIPASEAVLNEFAAELEDYDEGPRVWLALAALQLNHGELQPAVRREALRIIESEKKSIADGTYEGPDPHRRLNVLRDLKQGIG